jgi:signal transduction histidine kinase
MSLRRQLVALFAALAVVPLLLVGLLDYVRSIHALEDVIASNTAVIAGQAADELKVRFSETATELALFAENTAATALLENATHPARSPDSASLAYLRRLTDVTRKHFAWVVYRDTAANPVASFDDDAADARSGDNLYVATRPVRDSRGRAIGRVDAAIRMDSIYPRTALDAHFGRGGRTAVFDVATGFSLFAGAGTTPFPSLHDFFVVGDTTGAVRRLSYRKGDASYIASMAVAPATPFAVVSLGDVTEFSGPFGRIRSTNLFIVVLITVTVAVLFLLALWRATHALSELTMAADEVGRGNLAPQLPPKDESEVGKLAAAFSIMVARVRETLAEIERNRKLAAIGEFASQVSHEIRNPLTSIKLNLQVLERAKATGGIRPELAEPVEITLREVNRLDRVVRGVLQLGRGRVSSSTSFALHDAAAAAAESMRLGFERDGIALTIERRGNGDRVRGDRALVESAFINILRNASEAMPNGGAIRLVSDDATIDGRAVNRVRVEDRGPGVSRDERERIFSPFFTTKTEGSGLGLALAHRTIEEHQGRLWVEEREDGGPGAAFVVELPVAADE